MRSDLAQTFSSRSFTFRWTAVGCVACSATVHAQCVGMPAGSHAWIELANSNIPCGEAATGTTQLPSPSPNYCENATACNAGRVVLANADNRANRMRSATHMERGSLPFLRNSMVDTYTISGPSGTAGQPVTFRVRCHAVGTIYSSFHAFLGGNPVYLQGGTLIVDVGTWSPATNPDFLEQFRVNPFAPEFSLSITMGQAQSSTPRSLPVDRTIDQPLLRTVGQPFEIGYQIDSTVGTLGNVSGSPTPPDSSYLTATIDFGLPAGYSITSTGGWTSPNACVADTDDGTGSGTPDGGVSIDDLLYYLFIFEAGDSRADVDDGSGTGTPDGGVTIDDLLYYLFRFEAGC